MPAAGRRQSLQRTRIREGNREETQFSGSCKRASWQRRETKGASVRARMFETTLEYLYGKPAAEAPPEPLPVRVVWDIPHAIRRTKRRNN